MGNATVATKRRIDLNASWSTANTTHLPTDGEFARFYHMMRPLTSLNHELAGRASLLESPPDGMVLVPTYMVRGGDASISPDVRDEVADGVADCFFHIHPQLDRDDDGSGDDATIRCFPSVPDICDAFRILRTHKELTADVIVTPCGLIVMTLDAEKCQKCVKLRIPEDQWQWRIAADILVLGDDCTVAQVFKSCLDWGVKIAVLDPEGNPQDLVTQTTIKIPKTIFLDYTGEWWKGFCRHVCSQQIGGGCNPVDCITENPIQRRHSA